MKRIIIALIFISGCAGKSGDGPSDSRLVQDTYSVIDMTARPDLQGLDSGSPPTKACAGLIPEFCLLPYPSMAHLRKDTTTKTGYRLNIQTEAVPFETDSESDKIVFIEELNNADGFSLATPVLALFPKVHVDESTLPGRGDLAESVVNGSVQILHRETGERIALWAEMDNRAREMNDGDWSDDRRAMLIRPAQAMDWNTRYAVVVTTGVRTDNNDPLPRPLPFQALLSAQTTGDPWLDSQSSRFNSLFNFLEENGLERDSLVLAWEFHTMSRETAQAPLADLLSRADALDVTFEYESSCSGSVPGDFCDLDPDLNESTWRRIEGVFHAPSFLDESKRMQAEMTGTQAIPFVFVLPVSVMNAEPGSVGFVQFGHGLMSETWRYLMRVDDENGTLGMANHLGQAIGGCDMQGLSTNDVEDVILMLQSFDRMWQLRDKLLQGALDWHSFLKFVTSTLINDPALAHPKTGQPLLDPTRLSWFGVSQGGIVGVPYVLNSPLLNTAVFHVGSSGYAHLFQHSSEFKDLQLLMDMYTPDPLEQQATFALAQRAFDPVDPISWHDRVGTDPLPDAPAVNLLWQVAWGDANAPDWGAYMLARSAGVPMITPTTHEVFGMDLESTAPTPPASSGMVIFDTAKEPPSPDNAHVYDNGAHHSIRCTTEVYEQTRLFLSQDSPGMISLPCEGGPCFIEGIDCRTTPNGQ